MNVWTSLKLIGRTVDFQAAERRDGPRYVEAIRGARKMRHHTFNRVFYTYSSTSVLVWHSERKEGIPEGWISRG